MVKRVIFLIILLGGTGGMMLLTAIGGWMSEARQDAAISEAINQGVMSAVDTIMREGVTLEMPAPTASGDDGITAPAPAPEPDVLYMAELARDEALEEAIAQGNGALNELLCVRAATLRNKLEYEAEQTGQAVERLALDQIHQIARHLEQESAEGGYSGSPDSQNVGRARVHDLQAMLLLLDDLRKGNSRYCGSVEGWDYLEAIGEVTRSTYRHRSAIQSQAERSMDRAEVASYE